MKKVKFFAVIALVAIMVFAMIPAVGMAAAPAPINVKLYFIDAKSKPLAPPNTKVSYKITTNLGTPNARQYVLDKKGICTINANQDKNMLSDTVMTIGLYTTGNTLKAKSNFVFPVTGRTYTTGQPDPRYQGAYSIEITRPMQTYYVMVMLDAKGKMRPVNVSETPFMMAEANGTEDVGAWVSRSVPTPTGLTVDVARGGKLEVGVKFMRSGNDDVSYEIWRKPEGGSYKLVNTQGNTYFVDKTVTPGTRYSYKVRAFIESYGVKTYSKFTAPEGVRVQLVRPAIQADSKWMGIFGADVVRIGKVNGAQGYEVYVSDNGGKSFKAVTKNAGTSVLIFHTKLNPDRLYKVRAYTMVNGERWYSPERTVKVHVVE